MPRYLLETIVVVLIFLWLMGAFFVPVGVSLIHLLLVVLLVIVILRLMNGRRVFE